MHECECRSPSGALVELVDHDAADAPRSCGSESNCASDPSVTSEIRVAVLRLRSKRTSYQPRASSTPRSLAIAWLRACREPSRLQYDDLAFDRPGVEQCTRHARRLARTGRCHQHGDAATRTAATSWGSTSSIGRGITPYRCGIRTRCRDASTPINRTSRSRRSSTILCVMKNACAASHGQHPVRFDLRVLVEHCRRPPYQTAEVRSSWRQN